MLLAEENINENVFLSMRVGLGVVWIFGWFLTIIF